MLCRSAVYARFYRSFATSLDIVVFHSEESLGEIKDLRTNLRPCGSFHSVSEILLDLGPRWKNYDCQANHNTWWLLIFFIFWLLHYGFIWNPANISQIKILTQTTTTAIRTIVKTATERPMLSRRVWNEEQVIYRNFSFKMLVHWHWLLISFETICYAII